jgi:hypothetical protein
MEITKEEEKTNLEVLLPEVEIEGYVIKPWSFGKLMQMGPIIASIIPSMKDAGINEENIESRIEEVLLLFSPIAPIITSKTLGVKIDEVQAWDPGKGTLIFLTILSQNLERIKNSFGPAILQKLKNLKIG